jgi:hypothetical protein
MKRHLNSRTFNADREIQRLHNIHDIHIIYNIAIVLSFFSLPTRIQLFYLRYSIFKMLLDRKLSLFYLALITVTSANEMGGDSYGANLRGFSQVESRSHRSKSIDIYIGSIPMMTKNPNSFLRSFIQFFHMDLTMAAAAAAAAAAAILIIMGASISTRLN